MILIRCVIDDVIIFLFGVIIVNKIVMSCLIFQFEVLFLDPLGPLVPDPCEGASK